MFKKKANTNAAIFEDKQSLVLPTEVYKTGWEGQPSYTRKWNLHKIVYDEGENGYSVAIGAAVEENGKEGPAVCAIRWNGTFVMPRQGLSLAESGSPANGGSAEWFVCPVFYGTRCLKSANA